MKRAIGLIAILLVTILLFTGCTGSSTTPATPSAPSTLPAIQSEIASLKTQIATLSGTVSTLSGQVATASSAVDTTPLEVSIATLDAQIVTLTERITLLESGSGIVVDEEGNITTTTIWEPIRWRYDVSMTYKKLTAGMLTYTGSGNVTNATADLDLDKIGEGLSVRIEDVDPRTIKEEDLYDMELLVFNGNNDWDVTLTDVVFTVMLRPDDYAYLDEDMTYLDSDSSPYLDWDGSFVVREREGEDVTRRVEFESSKLNSLKIDNDSYEQMDLVLELYYG